MNKKHLNLMNELYSLPCLGETHHVIFATNGQVVFIEHEDIEAEVILNKMGGKCACAALYQGMFLPELSVEMYNILYLDKKNTPHRLATKISDLAKDIAVVRDDRKRQKQFVDPLDIKSSAVSIMFPRELSRKEWFTVSLAHLAAARGNEIAKSVTFYISGETKIENKAYSPSIVYLKSDWFNDVYKRGIAIVDGYFVISVYKERFDDLLAVEILSNVTYAVCRRYVTIERTKGNWSLSGASKAMLDTSYKSFLISKGKY